MNSHVSRELFSRQLEADTQCSWDEFLQNSSLVTDYLAPPLFPSSRVLSWPKMLRHPTPSGHFKNGHYYSSFNIKDSSEKDSVVIYIIIYVIMEALRKDCRQQLYHNLFDPDLQIFRIP